MFLVDSSLMFVIKARAYPRRDYLRGALLKQALAILANIIQGWESLRVTTPLAYPAHLYVTNRNSVVNSASGAKIFSQFVIMSTT